MFQRGASLGPKRSQPLSAAGRLYAGSVGAGGVLAGSVTSEVWLPNPRGSGLALLASARNGSPLTRLPLGGQRS
jgi:hypothetical protein